MIHLFYNDTRGCRSFEMAYFMFPCVYIKHIVGAHVNAIIEHDKFLLLVACGHHINITPQYTHNVYMNALKLTHITSPL